MAGIGFSRAVIWIAAGALLGALAGFVIQQSSLTRLRKENEALRQVQEEAQRQRETGHQTPPNPNQEQEMERLRADNQDLIKLRGEVAKLRPQAKELEKLRAENRALKEARRATATGPAAQPEAAPAVDEAALERIESIRCVNNLKQIGLAGRLWASAHDNVLPTDFLAMKQELGSPRILVCPAHKAKPQPESPNWQELDPRDITYELVASDAAAEVEASRRVFVRCPVHGHVCNADGSVVMGPAKP